MGLWLWASSMSWIPPPVQRIVVGAEENEEPRVCPDGLPNPHQTNGARRAALRGEGHRRDAASVDARLGYGEPKGGRPTLRALGDPRAIVLRLGPVRDQGIKGGVLRRVGYARFSRVHRSDH